MPLSRNTTKRVKHEQREKRERERERESLLEQFIVVVVGARVWALSFVFLAAPYFLMREQTKREKKECEREKIGCLCTINEFFFFFSQNKQKPM